MNIVEHKWTWTAPWPLCATNLEDKIHFSISPDADYVGQHAGFTLSFHFFPKAGKDFGGRSFRKKFKTWGKARRAGERALRFINASAHVSAT
jgi:hypothetical protein